MDSETISSPTELARCCRCGCNNCSIDDSSGTWLRSVKRKYEEFRQNDFFIPGLVYDSVARVQAENEIAALREMVNRQQHAIQGLLSELEEERNASRSAATEAMSMILRLQREKAEIQMEARQFKGLVEEKMDHDQHEILALEELLYSREHAIQSLTCEVQTYRHRMMSYGLTEEEVNGRNSSSGDNVDSLDSPFILPTYDYPPLKCNMNENHGNLEEGEDNVVDIEKYILEETPLDHMKNPSSIRSKSGSPRANNIPDKIIVGQSPPTLRHHSKFSADSSGSFSWTGRDGGSDMHIDSPRFNDVIFKKTKCLCQPEYSSPKLRRINNTIKDGDGMSDRIYTVDSVHTGLPNFDGGVGACEDYIATPKEPWVHIDMRDPDITKLYTRLQALESDGESIRHTIMIMQTDKAQIQLLKEIAQQLRKDGPSKRSTPGEKTSSVGKFSIWSMFKRMGSIFCRKKARQSKYMFGLSPHNMGLLMVLDKGQQSRQRKLVTRTIAKARV
ncbi:hypothetical protein SAY87_027352 [Trapa incisa]|uniref:GTD-binding domain-containing protein n=1 Tax=Trapa incisa TaxID=236973 RepID=A0AAN7JMI1_9MYRT|nr:hypothetical protein SAY87_027352 [Trapa incisa]